MTACPHTSGVVPLEREPDDSANLLSDAPVPNKEVDEVEPALPLRSEPDVLNEAMVATPSTSEPVVVKQGSLLKIENDAVMAAPLLQRGPVVEVPHPPDGPFGLVEADPAPESCELEVPSLECDIVELVVAPPSKSKPKAPVVAPPPQSEPDESDVALPPESEPEEFGVAPLQKSEPTEIDEPPQPRKDPEDPKIAPRPKDKLAGLEAASPLGSEPEEGGARPPPKTEPRELGVAPPKTEPEELEVAPLLKSEPEGFRALPRMKREPEDGTPLRGQPVGCCVPAPKNRLGGVVLPLKTEPEDSDKLASPPKSGEGCKDTKGVDGTEDPNSPEAPAPRLDVLVANGDENAVPSGEDVPTTVP